MARKTDPYMRYVYVADDEMKRQLGSDIRYFVTYNNDEDMLVFTNKKDALKFAKSVYKKGSSPAKMSSIRSIAEEASEAWADERDFDTQHQFMGAVSKLGGQKSEYLDALGDFNAWSLQEWVEDNW